MKRLKLMLNILSSAVIGAILAQMGFGPDTWQVWAIIIVASLMSLPL